VLFVLTGTYFFIFNGIRQAVALSLVFFSFRYIESRKLVPFLLIIAFAYLFHRSVLLVAPIYFVYKLNLSKFQLYMLIAISGICGFFGLITIFLSQFLELLGSKYAYYILKPVDTIGSGLAVYI
ncbi:EpsG family protein, partial [Vibrio breoganii]